MKHYIKPVQAKTTTVEDQPSQVKELETRVRELEGKLTLTTSALETTRKKLEGSIPTTPEYRAIETITSALKECPEESRQRVISWVIDVFQLRFF